MRWCLTHDVSVLVVNALVSSQLDYCNSLCRHLIFCKLQCIQNSAARIMSNTSRYASITPVHKKLHWLLEHHPAFKTATLVCNYLHTGFDPYISYYSSTYSTRHSRSGGNFLVVPKFQLSIHNSVKQFGYSFAFDAPAPWDALLDVICAFLFQKAAENIPLDQSILIFSLTKTLAFSVVLGFFRSLDTEIG